MYVKGNPAFYTYGDAKTYINKRLEKKITKNQLELGSAKHCKFCDTEHVKYVCNPQLNTIKEFVMNFNSTEEVLKSEDFKNYLKKTSPEALVDVLKANKNAPAVKSLLENFIKSKFLQPA